MSNREFKFRAWHKGDKEMSEFSFTNNLVAVEDKDNLVICSDGGGWNFHDEDLIVMQFTGIKDSAGKEVYEGDIFEPMDFNNSISYSVVRFENGTFALVPTHGEGWRRLLDSAAPLYKVIGNVHQNADLLST